jgi:hypothetical protein
MPITSSRIHKRNGPQSSRAGATGGRGSDDEEHDGSSPSQRSDLAI